MIRQLVGMVVWAGGVESIVCGMVMDGGSDGSGRGAELGYCWERMLITGVVWSGWMVVM